MEKWTDTGIVLQARSHGEGGGVFTLLTENHGLYAGYMPGAMSRSNQGIREIGSLVTVEWQARLEDHLGRLTLELERAYSAKLLNDSKRLLALKSACALCRTSLPEREPCPAQFHGLQALLEALTQTGQGDQWPQTYIAWEIGFLNEQGIPIDLSSCASTGQTEDLAYVSPKSGRAVSVRAGQPYKDKLLPLPAFLGGPEEGMEEDIHNGLRLTGHFLAHHLYGQTTRAIPPERDQLFSLLVDL